MTRCLSCWRIILRTSRRVERTIGLNPILNFFLQALVIEVYGTGNVPSRKGKKCLMAPRAKPSQSLYFRKIHFGITSDSWTGHNNCCHNPMYQWKRCVCICRLLRNRITSRVNERCLLVDMTAYAVARSLVEIGVVGALDMTPAAIGKIDLIGMKSSKT